MISNPEEVPLGNLDEQSHQSRKEMNVQSSAEEILSHQKTEP